MATKKIRIVCISDTHNACPGEGYKLPSGDILVHAGDLTNQGSLAEIRKAVNWLEKADFAVKIVIAGNHDLSLDPSYALKHPEGWNVVPEDVKRCRDIMREAKGITYLQHESALATVKGVEVKVFGSPYSPDRGKQNWALQYPDSEAEELWQQIPQDTDVLVTHTPPLGHVDRSAHWVEGGCPALAQAVARVRPMLHLCGHCHEGRGAELVRWGEGESPSPSVTAWQDPGEGNKKQSLLDLTSSRGVHGLEGGSEAAVVNASIMTRSWGRGSKAFNKPTVVDVEFPVQRGGDATHDEGGDD